MHWLTDWLRSIIMVILLATFIDLLLPSSTMQRYVKTVMSLFILLTLLTPVFSLFHHKWNSEQLVEEAMLSQDRLAAGNKEAVPALRDIERQSEQIKELQNKQSRRLAEDQLADRMRESIERQFGFAVKHIRVNTVTDAQGQTAIGNVVIVLQEKEPIENPKSDTVKKDIAIQPIQPVHIDLPNILPADSLKTSSGQEPSPEALQMKTTVINLLQRDWQLKSGQVDITVEMDGKL
jgi:stage III sporulation protein AF